MSEPTPITRLFADCRTATRMAFMPFITAGDPDLDMTAELIGELASRGVDLIEIGFPYSDPIADGPVIQASYTRALHRGTPVADILSKVQRLRAQRADLPPLIAMVSYAIIFRHGTAEFIRDAAEAGFAGLIVPDLPGDEARECFELTRAAGIDLIQLIAPTTPPARAREILKCCSGFVYCIAVAGTTGERAAVPEALLKQLRWLREETSLPLAIGFGISRPAHVAPLRGLAEGVIVGSAIVRQLEPLAHDATFRTEVLAAIGRFAAEMVDAVHSH